ncbi:MAG: hypothetical protein ABIO38_06225 [Luteimonas sp.]
MAERFEANLTGRMARLHIFSDSIVAALPNPSCQRRDPAGFPDFVVRRVGASEAGHHDTLLRRMDTGHVDR